MALILVVSEDRSHQDAAGTREGRWIGGATDFYGGWFEAERVPDRQANADLSYVIERDLAPPKISGN